MKPILINENNTQKIETYLSQVNGRSKERIIKYYSNIDWIIKYIENKIKNTKKKNRNGLKVIFREGACKFPNAYKYPASGTTLFLIYKNNKWYLEKAMRSDVRDKNVFDMDYPEALKKELIQLLEHLELY